MIKLLDIVHEWISSEYDKNVKFDGFYILINGLAVGYVEEKRILISGPTKNETHATMDDLIFLYPTDSAMFKKLKIILNKINKHMKICKTDWHLCKKK